jgi:hypothetical protein
MPHQASPFRLTDTDLARLAEVETMCRSYGCNPAASIELELAEMHRAHDYANRPILGVANSLNTIGDRAWLAAWNARREEHMIEARAEWARVTAPVLELAA